MTIIVTSSVWILLTFIAISIFGSPFLIEKPREPYSAFSYSINLFTAALIIIVIGRVMGWW